MNAPARISHVTVQPRGLRVDDACAYVGFKKTKFLELVGDNRMPEPIHVDGCVVWDRLALDVAFEALDATAEVNPWEA